LFNLGLDILISALMTTVESTLWIS